MSLKYFATICPILILGIAAASAQEGDLPGCLRRLESAVNERNRLLTQIDERTLSRSEADFVGGYRNTYSSGNVTNDLQECEDATANYEHWNGQLQDIVARRTTSSQGYETCVRELQSVAAQYNRCRVNKYQIRRYEGIEDCESALGEITDWLQDARAQGRCN